MLKPECLNPKEVLAYLDELGYGDISPQQLKEFIHDLIKLIKFDQKRKDIYNERQIQRAHICDCALSNFDSTPSSSEKSSSGDSCDSSVSSKSSKSSGTSDTSENSEIFEASESSSSITYKKNVNNKPNRKKKGHIEKIPTSFIRPICLSSRHRKNPDPVRLYHQYKETWSQFKIPGETSHSDLRWVIRNKMLGQEPTPSCIIN